MGVERFFDKTLTQKRKASRTSSTVEAWIDISTTLKGCIYPINPSDAIAFQSTYLRLNITHKMNCLIGVGTVSDSFAITDVDTVNEKITVDIDIATGKEIKFTTTGGLPSPLVVGTIYYAIRVDATHIKVATTLANANAGAAIDLTTQGTGTHTVTVLEDIKIDDKIVDGADEYLIKKRNSWGKFYEIFLSEIK